MITFILAVARVTALLLSFASTHWNQKTLVQIGQTLTGIETDDLMGYSISLSNEGKRLAIGSRGRYDSTYEIVTGLVQVFEVLHRQTNEKVWTQVGLDQLGWDVSLSHDGDWIAISDWKESARIFRFAESDWVQQGTKLEGRVVSMAENSERIVTAQHNIARVYEHDEVSDEWVRMGKDLRTTGWTEVAIAGNGKRIMVGEPDNENKHDEGGRVQVFDYNAITKEWHRLGQTIYGQKSKVRLGRAVSMSGDGESIVIGSWGGNFVKVFRYDGDSKLWKQQGNDIVGNEQDKSFFGSSVSMSRNGDRIIVGSWKYDSGRGRAVVYRLRRGSWIQIGDDILGTEIKEHEGIDVAISPDGNYVAVGAEDASSNELKHNGRVRVFQIV